jgi:hypothetical protein
LSENVVNQGSLVKTAIIVPGQFGFLVLALVPLTMAPPPPVRISTSISSKLTLVGVVVAASTEPASFSGPGVTVKAAEESTVRLSPRVVPMGSPPKTV